MLFFRFAGKEAWKIPVGLKPLLQNTIWALYQLSYGALCWEGETFYWIHQNLPHLKHSLGYTISIIENSFDLVFHFTH